MYAIEIFEGQYWRQVYADTKYPEICKAFEEKCLEQPDRKFRLIASLRFSGNYAEEPKKDKKEPESKDSNPEKGELKSSKVGRVHKKSTPRKGS